MSGSANEIWWIDPITSAEHHVTHLSWETKQPGGEWVQQRVTPALVDLLRKILDRAEGTRS